MQYILSEEDMNKDDFLSKRTLIKKKMLDLENELKELEDQYINDNAILPVGTKVAIIGRMPSINGSDKKEFVKIGFITGYDISYMLDDVTLTPIIRKASKDGKRPSAWKMLVYYNDEIVEYSKYEENEGI